MPRRTFSPAHFLLPVTLAVWGAACSNTESLDRRLLALEARIDSLADSVRSLSMTQRLSALFEGADRIAFLTPGASGYSIVVSDLGPLTIKLDDVQAYANGSRITLQLGNLTGATIDGATATVEWGPTDSRGAAASTSGTKTIKFSESLRPSAWTRVRIVLEGIAPQELGYVRVRDVTHEGIRLLR